MFSLQAAQGYGPLPNQVLGDGNWREEDWQALHDGPRRHQSVTAQLPRTSASDATPPPESALQEKLSCAVQHGAGYNAGSLPNGVLGDGTWIEEDWQALHGGLTQSRMAD